MTDPTQKKLTRRDAIKVLGAAAGASVLANLPSKWSKPELMAGVLPAHAATSGGLTLAASALQTVGFCFPTDLVSTVTVSPAAANIPMKYTIIPSAGVTISSPLTGTALTSTGPSAVASITFIATDVGGSVTDNVTVIWEFANPLDGTGSGSQVFQSTGC